MNTNVLGAVFKRNFYSYFSNPTGYVFICLFVALSTVAAFWPNDFFNNNLANLDQLNWVFPFIMLVFIPAITMAVWADERRQGTDELLLTIPADDLDVVLGKYLAAVAIYTVSLVVSLVSNWAVLAMLGSPDPGLLLGTYVGYWLLGLAMLSVGMVASFLTGNLTVAYVLGAIFNAPLVFAAQAEVIFPTEAARIIKQWSIGDQFYDFGRGVISLAAAVYYLAIVAIMLYLSVLLIGRRHWAGERKGPPMVLHYLLRTLSLVAASVGLVAFLHAHDLRLDVTSERLSSLSGETVKLLGELKLERPVKIEAFISTKVPESYVQTRLNLLSMLRELQTRSGGKVNVVINPTDRFSEEAARAEKRYGITGRQVPSETRGAMSLENIFMGVAFASGLQKVIIPFIDRGIPVEYELVRSLCTVAEQTRKRVGVVQTDAKLYGEFNFQSMSSSQNWPIIDELEKQYTVVKVDPANPISERYDVLLAVQPSSLGPEQMNNFVGAIKSGQPTLIFEDPFPIFNPDVPATSAPRNPPGGMNPMMMMMGGGQQQQQPKGDIGQLWNMLGVDFFGDQIVWQKYNPYRKAQQFPPEFVFVDEGSGAREPFNESAEVSAGLQHMLFPFPGAMQRLQASGLKFEPLVRTGMKTGTVRFHDIFQTGPFGGRSLNEMRPLQSTNDSYILAARISGKIKADQPMAAEDDKPAEERKDEEKKAEAKPAETEINVIVVADTDCLSRDFFRLREQGEIREAGIHFDFDNVTFVLNALDQLAGDERFIEIRKRRPAHRTLSEIDKRTEAAQREASEARERFMKEFEESERKERKALEDKVAELQKSEGINPQQLLIEVAMAKQAGERRLTAKLEQDRQERDKKINEVERKLNLEVRRVQDSYKMWAVLLPPVPPLLVAFGVFLTRRAREREGVSRARLR